MNTRARSRAARTAQAGKVERGSPGHAGSRQRARKELWELAPDGFEHLCERVFQRCGFREVTVTGGSGDGGVDGTALFENLLFRLRIVFQCKKYRRSVAVTEVRNFRGAVTGRAERGIILTTSTFTPAAREEAARPGAPRIELIDGEQLVEILKELQLGLHPVTAYEIDEDFFAEFRSGAAEGAAAGEFVSNAEVAAIRADEDLLARLATGSRHARSRKGRFVE